MRIGIIYPTSDAISPANWSGIPSGIADGLAANGAEVVPISASVPLGLREIVAVLSRSTGRRGEIAERMAISRWATTRALMRQLSQAQALNAVLAMGNEMYDLPEALAAAGVHVPVVTFDDATLAQQIRDPESDVSLAKIPDRLFARSLQSQRVANAAATVCCVSTRWAAESFRADYGIPANRITIVGMGHRPRWTLACEDRDWSVPRFLFVGAEWHRKNGAAVLDAFKALRMRIPEARLDLVGAHPPVDMPGVRCHGFLARRDASAQSLLGHLYATATCFVLPSRFDAAGIAYLEAASAGLAVVATTRGGAPEMLDDGAIAVDPYDRSALLDAMLTLSDPDRARTMGAAALKSASMCSWTQVTGRILDTLLRNGRLDSNPSGRAKSTDS